MKTTGDVFGLRPEPFETDAKIFTTWECWFTDVKDAGKVSRGTLRTINKSLPPMDRFHDGVPYKLVFANPDRMQAWYAR